MEFFDFATEGLTINVLSLLLDESCFSYGWLWIVDVFASSTMVDLATSTVEVAGADGLK
jgi:hypothetical protein